MCLLGAERTQPRKKMENSKTTKSARHAFHLFSFLYGQCEQFSSTTFFMLAFVSLWISNSIYIVFIWSMYIVYAFNQCPLQKHWFIGAQITWKMHPFYRKTLAWGSRKWNKIKTCGFDLHKGEAELQMEIFRLNHMKCYGICALNWFQK